MADSGLGRLGSLKPDHPDSGVHHLRELDRDLPKESPEVENLSGSSDEGSRILKTPF